MILSLSIYLILPLGPINTVDQRVNSQLSRNCDFLSLNFFPLITCMEKTSKTTTTTTTGKTSSSVRGALRCATPLAQEQISADAQFCTSALAEANILNHVTFALHPSVRDNLWKQMLFHLPGIDGTGGKDTWKYRVANINGFCSLRHPTCPNAVGRQYLRRQQLLLPWADGKLPQ